jgi:hypothetical protein
MDEKFSKKMGTVKKIPKQMSEMKSSINQIKKEWIASLPDEIKQKKEYKGWKI